MKSLCSLVVLLRCGYEQTAGEKIICIRGVLVRLEGGITATQEGMREER